MPGIDAFIETADRSLYTIAVNNRYANFGGNLGAFSGGCNPTFEAACQLAAWDNWRLCSNPPGLGYCTPAEVAADTANVWNVICAQALTARRQCTATRDFDLSQCTLQYGCAPGNTCAPDVRWGFRNGYGTCCPTGMQACGGGCYAPCAPPKSFDGRWCQCTCPPMACTPPYVADQATCTCSCPPLQCTGGKSTDQATCTCKCPPPLTDCNGLCVNTSNDPQHCGPCSNVCATGQGCCNGVCTPLTTNQNCGICGRQCNQGWKCCNRTCTQLGTSINCGDCGQKCLGGRVCQNGNCVCPTGQLPCGPMGACTPANQCCGGITCPGTQTCCGGQCVDTKTNNAHCGGCSQPCTGGRTCNNGVCVCPTGQVPCGPMSICATTCCNGVICPTNQSCCGGQCTNTKTNIAHCGGCNMPCPPNVFCNNGMCVAPPSTMSRACSQVVQNGSDMPVTVAVELAKTSGTFAFTFNAECIPDQFVLWYEGAVIFDTGCVTNGGYPNCFIASPVTVPVTFSGSSTQLLVQVIPNCLGPTSGTWWQFTVGCP